MPWTIRTDNGAPFASRAIAGISRLSIYWMKLGITPERIKPGHPEQNGRHERMHRTLKARRRNRQRPTGERNKRLLIDSANSSTRNARMRRWSRRRRPLATTARRAAIRIELLHRNTTLA